MLEAKEHSLKHTITLKRYPNLIHNIVLTAVYSKLMKLIVFSI